METQSFLAFFTLAAGFYMAWNIGANDVANAMGTSVGSKALTLKRAVVLAAILEFSGAFFVGSSVSETIQHGIVSPEIFALEPMHFVIGMMGSLIATGVLLQLASYFGLPISTTHAIVGAVLGFGLIAGGVDAIQWGEIWMIALSWVISPVISGIVSYAIFTAIQQRILYALDPLEATRKLTPFFVFLCIGTVSWSLFYKGLVDLHLDLGWLASLAVALLIALLAALLSRQLVQRMPQTVFQNASGFQPHQAVSLEKAIVHLQRVYLGSREPSLQAKVASLLAGAKELSLMAKKSSPFHQSTVHYQGVEKIFVYLQILSACLVAFAHGANDVANAIGPVSAVLQVLEHNTVGTHSPVPSWLLALGGAGIVIGLATWGWRVIETIGDKITELTPTRGFSAEFGAAVTILIASKLGLPISTTHALVGGVFGVGMARGLQALNLRTLKDIVVSWVVTIPFCAILSIACYYILRLFF